MRESVILQILDNVKLSKPLFHPCKILQGKKGITVFILHPWKWRLREGRSYTMHVQRVTDEPVPSGRKDSPCKLPRGLGAAFFGGQAAARPAFQSQLRHLVATGPGASYLTALSTRPDPEKVLENDCDDDLATIITRRRQRALATQT